MKELIGKKINNRFILDSIIGQGGMGCVFKALDLRKQEANSDSPYIAIKILNKDLSSSQGAIELLEQECAKTQILKHPNIVTVNDFDRDGDFTYITMELLEGKTLRELLNHKFKKGIPYPQAIKIIALLAQALSFAHKQGITHNDFKPENIFITDNNTVRIIDFGISHKTKDDEQSPQLGGISSGYSSFERYYDFPIEPIDDVYSLACVCYEIFTGKHPFNSIKAPEAKRLLLKAAPIAVLDNNQNNAILHALQWKRADRTTTVEQFYKELTEKKTLSSLVFIRYTAIVFTIFIVTLLTYLFINNNKGTSLHLNGKNNNRPELPVFPEKKEEPEEKQKEDLEEKAKDKPEEKRKETVEDEKPKKEAEANNLPVIFFSGSTKKEIDNAMKLCQEYSNDCKRSWYDTEYYKENSLAPFKLDKHEVSARHFAEFIQQTGYITTAEKRGYSYLWTGNSLEKAYAYTWDAPQGKNSSYITNPDLPVVNVSWRDANAYCRSKGGRLPSLEEWEYTARGAQRRIYPWGNKWVAENVNFASLKLSNVDSFAQGATPENIHHLSGNVWEWTRSKTGSGEEYYLKGGSFLEHNPANLRAAVSRTEKGTSTSIDDGFRCAYRIKSWSVP